MKKVFLKIIQCKRCSRIFYICQSCWPGQAYCCKACRRAARREAHCKSQKKYRQTEKGKEAHRRQERNRRLRNSQKTMDDPSTIPGKVHDNIPAESFFPPPCCRFCGRKGQVVDHFPWRGYGGRYSDADLPSFYCKGG